MLFFAYTKRDTKLNCLHTTPFAMNCYNYKQKKIILHQDTLVKKTELGKDECTRNRGCLSRMVLEFSRKHEKILVFLGLTHVKIGRLDSQEVRLQVLHL